MEVNTFFKILEIPESTIAELIMPKGISSITPLPVDVVLLEFPSLKHFLEGRTPLAT